MTELWNWKVDGRMAVRQVYPALADALRRPVLSLGAAGSIRPPRGAVLCEVWYRRGDFPTSVDCYGPPGGLSEVVAVAAFAHRLGRACLISDDTLDPTRHLLVTCEGTIRPVHLDVADTDSGEILTNQRLCGTANPGCRGWSACHQSRWEPDSVVPALAAA